MIGSQKSSKIDSLKDQYGRVIYNRHELYEMLYNGEDISLVKKVDWHEDFEKYNNANNINYYNLPEITAIDTLTCQIEDFDNELQTQWFIPDYYKNLDVIKYIKEISPKEHIARCIEELEEFKRREMLPLLQYMIYLVDFMREKDIVWGVGRGSSVASYVLYLIGVHRINSIYYELDWQEFLR